VSGNLSEGNAYANPRRMKGTFTRTYGVKVPFMRGGRVDRHYAVPCIQAELQIVG
jgi:hypothetical protein